MEADWRGQQRTEIWLERWEEVGALSSTDPVRWDRTDGLWVTLKIGKQYGIKERTVLRARRQK